MKRSNAYSFRQLSESASKQFEAFSEKWSERSISGNSKLVTRRQADKSMLPDDAYLNLLSSQQNFQIYWGTRVDGLAVI